MGGMGGGKSFRVCKHQDTKKDLFCFFWKIKNVWSEFICIVYHINTDFLLNN